MELQGWGSLLAADVEQASAEHVHGCNHEVAELDEALRPTGVWIGCFITRRDPVDGSVDIKTEAGEVHLGVGSKFVRIARPYECDRGCGFRGDFQAVSEHEASCFFIPAQPARVGDSGGASARRHRSSVQRTLTATRRLAEACRNGERQIPRRCRAARGGRGRLLC